MLEYLDFHIEIGPRSGEAFPLTVRSPAGEVRQALRIPFNQETLAYRLQGLENALLRSSIRHRRLLTPGDRSVQEFGAALFDAVFAGEVRSRYDVSRQEAAQRAQGLRLKLTITPPELAALPWEFLYDARQDQYLCLSRQTPLVRYLELPRAVHPLGVAPPLRILGLVANPEGLDVLDVANEQQRLETALQPLRAAGLVELVWLQGQTWRDLQQAMWRGPWHIFHFIGHGGFDAARDEGVIALAGDAGRLHLLPATSLARLVADHDPLRLVVLNACDGARGSTEDIFSSTAATLVRQGTPAVLAMQYPISDDAAIEFSRSFYAAIAAGFAVDAAVTEARKAISIAMSDSIEWATPVLAMHAPDGRIFNVTAQSVPVDHPPAAQRVAAAEQTVTAPVVVGEPVRGVAAEEPGTARALAPAATPQTISGIVAQTAALGALGAGLATMLLGLIEHYPSDATSQVIVIWVLGGGFGAGLMEVVVSSMRAAAVANHRMDRLLRLAAAVASGVLSFGVARLLASYTDRGTGLVEEPGALLPVALGALPVVLGLKSRLSATTVRAAELGGQGALAASCGSFLLAFLGLAPTDMAVPLALIWAIAAGISCGVVAGLVSATAASAGLASRKRMIALGATIVCGILCFGIAYRLASYAGWGPEPVAHASALLPVALGALPILSGLQRPR